MSNYDNRVFDVNGETKEQLILAFKLAFLQEGNGTTKAVAWKVEPNHGLVFYWWEGPNEGTSPFPVPLYAEAAANIAWEWLKTPVAKNIPLTDGFEEGDHDGDNREGFRVYTEKWGHVAGSHYSIIAVSPAWLWIGK